MAIPGIVGTATGGRSGSGAFTVTPPAGAAGYVAVASWRGTLTQLTAPTGWTAVSGYPLQSGSDDYTMVGIWTAGASPGSSWNHGTSNGGASVVVVGYDGALTVHQSAGSSATLTCPSVTTSEGSLLLRAVMRQSFNGTPAFTYPASATLGRDQHNQLAASEYWSEGVAHESRAATGATGTAAFTANATQWSARAHTLALTTAGSTPNTGSATGAVAFAGSTTGARAPKGTVSGAVAWSGSATGAATRIGTASGAVAWAGTAQGAQQVAGTATGAVSWSASATGATDPQGAAAGGVSWAGSAAGDAPAVGASEGAATGAVSWAASGEGHRAPAGAADGTVSWAGAAVGGTATGGTATGAAAWAGAATGHRSPKGYTAGTHAYVGAAAGVTSRGGTASGAVTWAGSVTRFTAARSPRASIAGNTYRAVVLEPAGGANLPGNAHRATITSSSARAEMT